MTECTECGFVISDEVPGTAAPFQTLSTILFAEDSGLIRSAIEEALVERKLADSVLGAKDGEEFLDCFAWHLSQGTPVQLVVLDVEMPIIDGFTAALAMRAFERGTEKREPTPIVFFSSQPCNDRAREVIEKCGRALYINKASSPDFEALVNRVEAVLKQLFHVRAAS